MNSSSEQDGIRPWKKKFLAGRNGRRLMAALNSAIRLTKLPRTFHQRVSASCPSFVPLVVLSVCLLTFFSFAQTANTGALTGTITDPSGAVVSNATVKVINEATGDTRTVTSGDRGDFSAPLLPPGSYRVDVSKTGFKVSVLPKIQVNVTETGKLNIRLSLGNVSENVTVNSEAEQ